VYLLPLLCFLSVFCKEKFDLDDAEKDQLQFQISNRKRTTSTETLHTDETKYSAKAKPNQSQEQQQQYHGPTTSPPPELGNQLEDYAEPQSYENFKFAVIIHDYLRYVCA
jgi:hypothetical protein